MGLLFAIIYAEAIWYLIKTGKRPYESMNGMLKFIVAFNYVLAILLQSPVSLEFAIICSLYQMIVFKVRANKWS